MDLLCPAIEKCKGWSRLHSMSWKYYERIHNLFNASVMILMIAIWLIAALMSVERSRYFIVAINTVSIALKGYTIYKRHPFKAERHFDKYNRFTTLRNMATTHIRDNPQSLASYCEDFTFEYNQATNETSSEFSIPASIISKFYKECKGVGPLPEIVETMYPRRLSMRSLESQPVEPDTSITSIIDGAFPPIGDHIETTRRMLSMPIDTSFIVPINTSPPHQDCATQSLPIVTIPQPPARAAPVPTDVDV